MLSSLTYVPMTTKSTLFLLFTLIILFRDQKSNVQTLSSKRAYATEFGNQLLKCKMMDDHQKNTCSGRCKDDYQEYSKHMATMKFRNPPKITSWRVMTSDGIVSLSFFLDTMNAEGHLTTLQDKTWPVVNTWQKIEDFIIFASLYSSVFCHCSLLLDGWTVASEMVGLMW